MGNEDREKEEKISFVETITAVKKEMEKLNNILSKDVSEKTLENISSLKAILDGFGRNNSEYSNNNQVKNALYFDISDLIIFFRHNRLPTGIQRVQIGIINNIFDTLSGVNVILCRIDPLLEDWVEVSTERFRRVALLSLAAGDSDDEEWRAEVDALHTLAPGKSALSFPRDAVLISIGASWGIENYFIYIREAKEKHNICYIPFVHDVVPAIAPAYCHPDDVKKFIGWLLSVLQHADYYISVSDSAKKDLITAARILGVYIPSEHIVVVTPATEIGSQKVDSGKTTNLAHWNLSRQNYVLCIGTLEARKNQIGAFEVWKKLIMMHGKEQVPTLVCISGTQGYKGDQAIDCLNSNPDLQSRAIILRGINDTDLKNLYENCLFTVFPSFYEGWGLPVTESLRYGKPVITADNSSLPQAGMGLSVLYKTGSQKALLQAVEKMIFDQKFRAAKEEEIKKNFVLRTWSQVVQDLQNKVLGMTQGATRLAWVPPLAPQGYYTLTKSDETALRAGTTSSEVYRYGTGWGALEAFGSRIMEDGAGLSMRLSPRTRRIAIHLIGPPHEHDKQDVRCYIETNLGVVLRDILVPVGKQRWVFIDLPPAEKERTFMCQVWSSSASSGVYQAGKKQSADIGVSGFFIFNEGDNREKIDFLEAVSLGGLEDYKQRTLPVTSVMVERPAS